MCACRMNERISFLSVILLFSPSFAGERDLRRGSIRSDNRPKKRICTPPFAIRKKIAEISSKILILINGAYGRRICDMAKLTGIDFIAHEFAENEGMQRERERFMQGAREEMWSHSHSLR